VLNRVAFEALDPTLRDALLEAARVAEERGWGLSRREAGRRLARMEERGFSPMEAPARLWADVVETRRESTVEWTARTGEEGVGVIQAFYAPR
jgi:TRAP-type C4-dicarboxylate transport system substrate-binding protein